MTRPVLINAHPDPGETAEQSGPSTHGVKRILVKRLGRRPYEPVWRCMQNFTEQRDAETADELWVLEHDPVYTLGLNAKTEHVLNPNGIPVVAVDRGGQVTYHGPGQVIAYPLIDLKRRRLGVRRLVTILETAAIALLRDYGLRGHAKPEAPGVYVNEAKIASLGLRVRRGCSYHGLSFNAAMDLRPFQGINPCGYAGLEVTHLEGLAGQVDTSSVAVALTRHLIRLLDEHPAS